MSFVLGPVARASGYRLVAHETLDSTNAEAIRLAAAGDPGRLWVVAEAQTDGRGRRGRAWRSPRGNLLASVLLPVAGEDSAPATLGFAAGLAVVNAVSAVAPGLAGGLRLKWPNDLLLDNAKLTGILLEAANAPEGTHGVVIGIGVNVAGAPNGLSHPVTSLAEKGADISAADLLHALSDSWVEAEALWDGGCGFAAIRDRWLEHAAGLGRPIAVRVGSQESRGLFETIDGEGRLVIREPGGACRAVSAGDVFFGAAATSEA